MLLLIGYLLLVIINIKPVVKCLWQFILSLLGIRLDNECIKVKSRWRYVPYFKAE